MKIGSLELVQSAFDPGSVPKFMAAVMGSFPSVSDAFALEMYGKWKDIATAVAEIMTDADVANAEQAQALLVDLDGVVALRAISARGFIDGASSVYTGKNAVKLMPSIRKFLQVFFDYLSVIVDKFFACAHFAQTVGALKKCEDLTANLRTKAVTSAASTQTDE